MSPDFAKPAELFAPANGSRVMALFGRRLPDGIIAATVDGGVASITVDGKEHVRFAPPLRLLDRIAAGLRVVELPALDMLARFRDSKAPLAGCRHVGHLADDLMAGESIVPPGGRPNLLEKVRRIAVAGTLSFGVTFTGLAGVAYMTQDHYSSTMQVAPATPVLEQVVGQEAAASMAAAMPQDASLQSVTVSEVDLAVTPQTTDDMERTGTTDVNATIPSSSRLRHIVTRPGFSDNGTVLPIGKPVVVAPLPEHKPVPPVRYDLDGGAKVKAAIVEAAAVTGASLPYLIMTAEKESNFDIQAEAGSSSASGLFQFTAQTWMATLVRYGDRHGAGHLADKIREGKLGGYTVKNKADLPQILKARYDPHLNAMMAAELSLENRASLAKSLGREPDDTELYLMHLFGIEDGVAFLRKMRQSPDAPAAPSFRKAAAANPGVFEIRKGRTFVRHATFAEIRQAVDQRFAMTRQYAEGMAPEIYCHGIEREADAVRGCIDQAYDLAQRAAAIDGMKRKLRGWNERVADSQRMNYSPPIPEDWREFPGPAG